MLPLRREGATELRLPDVRSTEGPRPRRPVFYNPAMSLDRDLAVAFVRADGIRPGVGLTGWEVAAATGVRGLRLVVETGRFAEFDLTEAHPGAYRVLRENAEGRDGVRAILGDGRRPPTSGAYEFVDVDPYGSPLPFLPAALTSVVPGGVLGVTATDLMVLAGAQPSACLRRYGARPVSGRLGPEGGLRILLATIASMARASARSARPLLAYVLGHHVRAYVRVGPGDSAADPIAEIDPATWSGPRLSGDGPYGPLWLGPLFDPELVGRLQVPPSAARPDDLARLLAVFREERAVDRPFYYESNALAHDLRVPRPPPLSELRDELARRGHRTVRTHARPEGFRTDAPRDLVEAAVRSWAGVDQSQNARVRA